MRAGRTALLLLILLSGTIVGCGGSGSSGFDVLPSEARAVAEAIDEGVCVDFEAQTFCASGVPAQAVFEGASVIIEDPPEPLICDGSATPETCTAALDFTTEGFRHVNSLLAAVSYHNELGPWTLVPLEATEDVLGPRVVTIQVPGDPENPDTTDPSPFIAAVLVYAGVPPETLPTTAERLADFGVDLVYVSRRLEIVVPR